MPATPTSCSNHGSSSVSNALGVAAQPEMSVVERPMSATPVHEPHDRLAREIAQLAAHIEAATYRLLSLIREFDQSGGWHLVGARSCAHWLSWRIGWGLPAARERVRVARVLGDLPLIGEALRKGEISYSKVRAITRIASPENEQTLVSYAYHNTAAQVEKVVRFYRNADRTAQAELDEKRQAGRELTTFIDDDGMLVLRGRLSPEQGAVVLKALQLFESDAGHCKQDGEMNATAETSPQSARPSADQRRADALAQMAQAALGQMAAGSTTVKRTQVVLHVDIDAQGEQTNAHFEPDLPAGPETVRRHTCDASVVTITHGADGEVLDVGRKRRTIPPAIRRALRGRAPQCAFPGCNHTRFLHAHHIQHWADGGPTKLDNLIHVCSAHHQLLHEGGFGVSVDDSGQRLFTTPGGRVIPAIPPVVTRKDTTAETLEEQNTRHGLEIDDQTLGTWDGAPPDYAMGVERLWSHRPSSA
jgi:hypothetical protein